MRLKRLQMIGFKSFADAFELNFQEGITAIVGPNGCGKSNVAEAVRWVLGTQSPNELRVDRMEEVIFAGSEERKSLGMAEVTLELDNRDRTLPVDFDEVSITRRLFRAGESEYLINGNKCRLMDVTDLLVDEGLGSNGYWILERAMVETILSNRPEDRRFLFDQAAGITRYKIQRHRAELKLDATGRDLERIEDIVQEVESAVSSLKKQVNAFRRYEKAARKIEEVRGVLKSRRMEGLSERLEELGSSLEEMEKKEEDLRAAQASTKSSLSAERTRLENVQADLDRSHSECSRLERESADAQRELAVYRERMSTTEARLSELAQAGRDSRSRSEELDAEAAELGASRERKVEELENSRIVAADLGAEIEDRRSSRHGLRRELEKARKKMEDFQARTEELQSTYREELVRKQERSEEAVRLALERDSTQKDMEELEPRIEGTEEKRNKLRKELDGLEEAVDRARARRERKLEDVESKEAEVRALEARREVLESRISSLERSEVGRKSSALSEAMEVGPDLAKAVGAYLDAFQDAVLTDDLGPDRTDSGGLRVAVARKGEPARPDLPRGARWLPDCVEAVLPGASLVLARGVLAPDRKTALDWFLNRTDLDIVTPEGDLFRADGLVRLGVPDESAGTIEREGLLSEAREELRELEDETEDARGRCDEARKELADEESRMEQAQAESREAEKKLAALDAILEGLRNRRRQLKARMEELRAAARETEPEEQVDIESLEAEITESGKSQVRAAGEVERTREKLEEVTVALEELSRKKSEADLVVGRLEADLERLDETVARLERDSEQARRSAEAAGKRIEENRKELENLRKRAEELEEQSDRLDGKRQEAERKRIDLSKARGEVLQGMAELENRHSGVSEELSSTRERRTELSGEAALLQSRLEELDEAELVLPKAGSKYYEFSDEKLRKELERQTGYRERLGPVNMLAVEEYEEAKKRLQFLTEQREDLLGARASLLQAIDEINRTATLRFERTFEDVRGNFRELFMRLFGGGQADIVAVDAEDPLESGVRILASPRGKTLKNVSALSDGERALTAVALLFALYLVKPSPFCLLDELDAPLDDSNIDRFVDLLRSFMEKTQFIVITHNKRTMEAADILYGITMQESGVSTATTVRLEEVEA
ncbi:chromosome segregation protein SMC [Candidatus Fermentibacteria bacterium]|nr:chromosome segregation protein SMC [Candidatus Fermentibacteria bacterium]